MQTPKVINSVLGSSGNEDHLYTPLLADYTDKVIEIQRITGRRKNFYDSVVPELQTQDPIDAAKHKAYQAWKSNSFTPTLIEDNSLFVVALDGYPGPLVSFTVDSASKKRTFCEIVFLKNDARAVAQTTIAIFNGENYTTWSGIVKGHISPSPKGSNGFGWDDIFIPRGKTITFAQMKPKVKDKYSMRAKAWKKFLKNPFEFAHPVYQLPEPFPEELERIRHDELSSRGRKFGVMIEQVTNSKISSFEKSAETYKRITKENNKFYVNYHYDTKSPSLGLIITNIDSDRIETKPNGIPVFWQMGPKRRQIAFAQRSHFFDQNQNRNVHKIIKDLEKGVKKIPHRANKRSLSVEKALGFDTVAANTPALTELGYKKISTSGEISRRHILTNGLFNMVGRYPRKIIGLGSMPPVTGWRDTIVTAATGHMVSFIPRNSIFAGNTARRIDLVKSANTVIDSFSIQDSWKKVIKRNIGASVGLGDIKLEMKDIQSLHKKAGVKLFRIYTIGSDSRVITMAKTIRQTLGHDVEIFVGQIADKKQAEKLIHPSIDVDGIIFGHGGGQQCTSAINGMAITTLEDVYEITLDPSFNKVSILVEGGIDRSIGTALLLGIDCCLGNQKLVHGTVETGDLFIQTKKGKFGQPYPGSASPVTQIIESANPEIRSRRIDPSGRAYNTEGKPGFMYFEKKANSMVFWINEFLSHAARTLADLGVKDIAELRQMQLKNTKELLRIMSSKTQYLSDAFGSYQ